MASTNDRQKIYREDVSHKSESPPLEDRKRREVVKKIALGTAALTGCSLLPERWTTPLVEFGALPAHATTSGLIEELARAIEQSEAQKDAAAAEQVQAPQPAEPEAAQPAAAEAPAAEEKEESEWTTVAWGGNPNETSDNRDRTWWTKIHGGSWPHWHRKFPLPGWVDDQPYRLEFVFSDGATFNVSNSTKMEMNANGPKYVPEDPGESDSRKQHPKIGAAVGAKPTWVKFRKV